MNSNKTNYWSMRPVTAVIYYRNWWKTMWAFIMGKPMKSIRMRQLMKLCRCLTALGCGCRFIPMTQPVYLDICAHYLAQTSFQLMRKQKPLRCAFASERGGRSGRVAYQFSRYYIGMPKFGKLICTFKPRPTHQCAGWKKNTMFCRRPILITEKLGRAIPLTKLRRRATHW